jgi:adenylyl-sulfate kinase
MNAADPALAAAGGAVVWLTGLPSAGKSTIAEATLVRMRERGHAAIVLDGDRLRRGLCSDLGFSPPDRAENVRRIGEVAALLCEAGAVALVAVIAPYRRDRERARALAHAGRFVEVFVDTPLSVCESRDPKGLYKKARAGLLPDFTGVHAPYEAPERPELVLRGDESTPEAHAQTLFDLLVARGLL